MRRNNVWLKLIAIIIIQALLLTQVDFSLAAMFHAKESYQEAALKYQRTADKNISFVSGITCIQLALSGLNLPRFNLQTILTLLKGNGTSSSELEKRSYVHSVNNVFYKVCILNAEIRFESKLIELLRNKEGGLKLVRRNYTEQSTAPPLVILTNVVNFTKPNC